MLRCDAGSDPADLDRGLLNRLNAINNTLTTQWNRLQSIRSTVDHTGTQADRARDRVRDAENLIDRARQELDKAKEAVGKVVSRLAVVMATSTAGGALTDPVSYHRTSNHPVAPESPTT